MSIKGSPAICIEHRGTEIFHAYKDEYSDVPLDNWYTLNPYELPGGESEFDIRDFRVKIRKQFVESRTFCDVDLLKFAIEKKLLQNMIQTGEP